LHTTSVVRKEMECVLTRTASTAAGGVASQAGGAMIDGRAQFTLAINLIIILASVARFMADVSGSWGRESGLTLGTFGIVSTGAWKVASLTIFDGGARFAIFTVTVLAILAAAGRLAARNAQTGFFV
jgi:hypothetical protein